MTEKDLIEFGFMKREYNDVGIEPFLGVKWCSIEHGGPRHNYTLGVPPSCLLITPDNIELNSDEWGVWLELKMGRVLITDMEDLKTIIQIVEKCSEEDNSHLFV